MFEPVRGGTRGGQGEFKWSDVGADKDRENYLGHSINAPTGRWQKNKDIHWYNRDAAAGDEERREEIRKVKEAEADALAVALGFDPAPKAIQTDPNAAVSGSNAVAVAVRPERLEAQLAEDKAEKQKRKAEKEAKKAEKEAKRAEKEERRTRKKIEKERHHGDDRDRHGRRGDRERSRSPRRMESPSHDRSSRRPRSPDRERNRYDRSRSPRRVRDESRSSGRRGRSPPPPSRSRRD